MGDLHRSSSIEQQDAEPLVLMAIAEQIGVTLAPASIELPRASRVEVDGADGARSVFAEV